MHRTRTPQSTLHLALTTTCCTTISVQRQRPRSFRLRKMSISMRRHPASWPEAACLRTRPLQHSLTAGSDVGLRSQPEPALLRTVDCRRTACLPPRLHRRGSLCRNPGIHLDVQEQISVQSPVTAANQLPTNLTGGAVTSILRIRSPRSRPGKTCFPSYLVPAYAQAGLTAPNHLGRTIWRIKL